MFSFTFRLRDLLIWCVVFLILILISVETYTALNNKPNADSFEKRCEFIKTIGIDVSNSNEICNDFFVSDESDDFNKVLKQSGFDLLKYKDTVVKKYSYIINGNRDTVNLIVDKGYVIGGYIYDNASYEYNALFDNFGE